VNDYRLPFDEPIFHAINGLELDWLNQVWVLASDRNAGTAVAVAMGLLVVIQLKAKAVRPVLQVALTLLIVDQGGHELLKPFFGRMRPCFALPAADVHRLVEIANSGSMPSLHAANSFGFAVGLWLCLPGSARYTFPVAVLIALSRIGVGVHWPSDIVAGALFGAAVAAAIHFVFERFKSKEATSSRSPSQG
jgi:undecaprenyl-diphosphatase